METTAPKCKKGPSVLKVVATKGIEQRHLFLLYQGVSVSVTDYGPGLTTMAQTNLLKLDRVQNEAMPVRLGTTKDTPIQTMRFMLDLLPGQSIHQYRRKSPQLTPRSRERHNGMQMGCRLGRGKSWMGQAEDSILQVWQLTELKQTTEWERYPNRFRRLYETLLPENLGKHCREWPAGKTESEIKFPIQENRKPQDLIVYTDDTFIRDQSGWGFTVKQGVTTIHEDSAAYTVSTSSLTMEEEAVTHALHWIASRGDSRTTHAIILTD